MSEFRWEILWIVLTSLGCYVLLVMTPGRGRTILGVTIGIALTVGTGLLLTDRADWWAVSNVVSGFTSVLLPFLAAASVCFALVTIATRNDRTARTCFVGLVLTNGILFLLVGAHIAAIATVIFASVAAFALFGLWSAEIRLDVKSPVETMLHEPFLACVAGGGFAVGLIVTVVGATHSESSSANGGRQMAALPSFRTVQSITHPDLTAADGRDAAFSQPTTRQSALATHAIWVAAVVLIVAAALIVVTVLNRGAPVTQSADSSSLRV